MKTSTILIPEIWKDINFIRFYETENLKRMILLWFSNLKIWNKKTKKTGNFKFNQHKTQVEKYLANTFK